MRWGTIYVDNVFIGRNAPDETTIQGKNISKQLITLNL